MTTPTSGPVRAATSSHAQAQDIAREERRYLLVFFWLFVLTVLEIAVTYLHAALGRFVVGAMLCLLAATKASMVGLYYMHLVHEKKTLTYIALTPAILCVFLIPFLGLLGIRSKRTPMTLTLFATISLFGLWLFHFMIVAPTPFPDFIAFGWIEALVAIGMLGTFWMCFLTFVRAFPPLAIAAGLPTDEEELKLRRETGPLHDV